MKSLFVENLKSSCGGFSMPNILMKVTLGEAYQYEMLSNAYIASWDMQGGSCSNIILYNGVMKWSDNLAMTLWSLKLERNLQ